MKLIKATILFCLCAYLQLVAAQTRPLVIVAEDYAPATFMDKGNVTGFDVDIAKAVFDSLGISYEIKLVP
ncbi:transporter substrate-binding domain-containing protein [Solimicrobium silvestre]|uniref:Bacterial extracellular solute-binding protein, family 3 n=1 Tax=Solimicrobium silvestre TaxID=2099400 RepID=A0A2S9H3T1_9BURK|nr:transporter substrate-binding domain-containing protein [Solimicrobium silvestre]PRC94644.1 Bacterial extracellular solute-binding protein, family 3 [Solimicrobium silvestre]